MYILKNQIRFNPQKYGEESIILESKIDVVYMGSWQHRFQFYVQKTELSLQDLSIDLDELTELSDSSLFTVRPARLMPYGFDDQVIQGIQIMMDLDLRVIQRSGYTVLDIMSDVGGLQSVLFSGISLFLVMCSYNAIDNYLVSRLYRLETEQDMSRRMCCLFRCLPKRVKCGCFKSSKHNEMVKARMTLNKEIDIVKLIR